MTVSVISYFTTYTDYGVGTKTVSVTVPSSASEILIIGRDRSNNPGLILSAYIGGKPFEIIYSHEVTDVCATTYLYAHDVPTGVQDLIINYTYDVSVVSVFYLENAGPCLQVEALQERMTYPYVTQANINTNPENVVFVCVGRRLNIRYESGPNPFTTVYDWADATVLYAQGNPSEYFKVSFLSSVTSDMATEELVWVEIGPEGAVFHTPPRQYGKGRG